MKTLTYAVRRCLQRLDDFYAEEVKDGPTRGQLLILQALKGRRELNQTDLVHWTRIDRSTLGEIMPRLVERGWITRMRDPSDMRQQLVKLNSMGRSVLKKAELARARAEKRLLAKLEPAERDQFVCAVSALGDAS